MSPSRSSAANKRTSSNSTTPQKRFNGSKSHGSSASKSHFTNDKTLSSRQISTTDTCKRDSVLDGNAETLAPPVPISVSDQQQAFRNQQYSTAVISGCASLGVDIPTSIYQTLVDQHGQSSIREYSDSTLAVDPQSAPESQQFATHRATSDWSCGEFGTDHEHTWNIEVLHGDLAGIGAQFDASIAGWKSGTDQVDYQSG